MMMARLAAYLGSAVDGLLSTEPFSGWRVVRSVEHEPREEIRYEFEGCGVEVICDEFDRIQTVFLHRGIGESLVDIPFSMSRWEVLERFGAPAKSGGPVSIPGIPDRGEWDRFALPEAALHIQYRLDRDEIDMITLIRPDAVP